MAPIEGPPPISDLLPADGPPLPTKPYRDAPTDETALRSQWELEHAPFRTPEETATIWMRDICRFPVEGVDREEREYDLRHQLITVYGREAVDGEVPDEEILRIVRRRGWLGLLVAPEPIEGENHEREAAVYDQKLEQAKEFSDDFVHLVLKDAEVYNKARDGAKERERLHELATHDPLTGLKNRRGLIEDLDELITLVSAGEVDGLALLYIDIDEFKAVNDTLGHDVGDALLKGAARVIEHRSRKPERGGRIADVIARPSSAGSLKEVEEGDGVLAENIRMGGDEFVKLIVFEGNPANDHASKTPEEQSARQEILARIARRQTEELGEYLQRQAGGRVKGVGASVGYVMWEQEMSADELIRRGDMHMYGIKVAKKKLANKGITAIIKQWYRQVRSRG